MSHVMVWRGDLPEDGLSGFWHHGILCEDGSIIHYTGMDGPKTFQNATILRTDMADFLGRGARHALHTVEHREAARYTAQQVARRAESRLGHKGYDLMRGNCENFARWCVVGDDSSRQVQGYGIGLTGGLASLLLGGGLAGAVLTTLVVQRAWDAAFNRSGARSALNARSSSQTPVQGDTALNALRMRRGAATQEGGRSRNLELYERYDDSD